MTAQPVPPPAPPRLPLRRRPLFTPYVVMWSIGGALALGYIAVLFTSPDLLEDLTPSSSYIADPQSNEGQRAAARLAMEINSMRDSISQIQLDLSRVKTDVADHGARDKALTSQLVVLERKLSGAADEQATETAEAARRPAPPKETSNPRADWPPELRVEAPGLVVTPARPFPGDAIEASLAPRTPMLINADATAKAEPAVATTSAAKTITKTVAKPAPATTSAFTTAVIRQPDNPVGVVLSRGASVDSLRLSWSLLADQHGDTLRELEPRYVSSGNADNPRFELVAGPVKSRTEAQRLCKALTARNIPCRIGDFAGNAL